MDYLVAKERAMQVTTNSPFNIELQRRGGAIIVCRVDYWLPTQSDWDLKDSTHFNHVTTEVESHSVNLASGHYTVVAKFFVEESINGVFDFNLLVNGQSVSSKSGDVNKTSSSSDSMTYKSQFVLHVQ